MGKVWLGNEPLYVYFFSLLFFVLNRSLKPVILFIWFFPNQKEFVCMHRPLILLYISLPPGRIVD